MACRAIQLITFSEDTAHVASLPQSMWPKRLPQLVPEGCRRLRAVPGRGRSLAAGSCFAVSGAGLSVLCRPAVWGGRPALELPLHTRPLIYMEGIIQTNVPLT